MSGDRQIVLRCGDCAYVNPDGSKYCGMCGSRLSMRKPTKRELKKEHEKITYENYIADGSFGKVAGYGSFRWQIHAWGLGALLLLVMIVGVYLNLAQRLSNPGALKTIHYAIMNYTFITLILGAASKIHLDIVRGNPPRVMHGLKSALLRIFPLFWIFFIVLIIETAILTMIVVVVHPGTALFSENSPFPGDSISSLLGLIWVVSIGLMAIPATIFLFLVLTVGMCRVMDRGKNPWSAPIWTMVHVRRFWGALIAYGVQALIMQLTGMAFMWIGLLGTTPMCGVNLAAAYEWIRLHSENPDEY